MSHEVITRAYTPLIAAYSPTFKPAQGLGSRGGALQRLPQPNIARILATKSFVGNATWPALPILTQQGDSGAKVHAVQSQLNESGTGIAVDGAFGPATATAVKNFQTSKGLGADGIVGDDTWNKMAW